MVKFNRKAKLNSHPYFFLTGLLKKNGCLEKGVMLANAVINQNLKNQVKTRGEIFYRPVISKENTVGEQEGGTPVG